MKTARNQDLWDTNFIDAEKSILLGADYLGFIHHPAHLGLLTPIWWRSCLRNPLSCLPKVLGRNPEPETLSGGQVLIFSASFSSMT